MRGPHRRRLSTVPMLPQGAPPAQKPGGLLYLSMPVGADLLRFNHCRVYGRLRLPLVLAGWILKDSYGYSEQLLEGDGSEQPLFVLQKPAP